MKKILTSLLLLIGLLFAAGASQAADAPITLRAYPGEAIRLYPLDNQRGLQSLVLQNLAIINSGGKPAVVTAIDIDLLSSGDVVDSRHLTGPAIDRFAKGGAALQGSGAMQMFAFQFGGVLGEPPPCPPRPPWPPARPCWSLSRSSPGAAPATPCASPSTPPPAASRSPPSSP